MRQATQAEPERQQHPAGCGEHPEVRAGERKAAAVIRRDGSRPVRAAALLEAGDDVTPAVGLPVGLSRAPAGANAMAIVATDPTIATSLLNQYMDQNTPFAVPC